MASREIRAGRAFVEMTLRDGALIKGLQRAQQRLSNFGSAVGRVGLQIAAATTAIFAPLGIAVIRNASDAQEALSRFEQVFKDQASAARAFADSVARDVGRSKFAILNGLATFQSFFVGLGFGASESRQLSQQLQALSIDFASFNNISDQEGLERFISALSGSSEVLDRFGINIKQAALEQELLAMGVNKTWTEVTEQEKTLARLNVIMRAMGDQGAVGNAVRTAGSFANQMKRLGGEIYDASIAIGQALLPVVTPLVKRLGEITKTAAAWIKENQGAVIAIAKLAVGALAGGIALVVFGAAIKIAAAGVVVFLGVIAGAKLAISLVANSLLLLLSPVGLVIAGMASLGAVILFTSQAGADALKWLGDKFGVLKGIALKAFEGISDALASGDVKLAAEVLWAGLELAWVNGVASLSEAWREFLFGMNAALQIAGNFLATTMAETMIDWQQAWSNSSAKFKEIWGAAAGWVADRMLEAQGIVNPEFDVEGAKAIRQSNTAKDTENIRAQRERERVAIALRGGKKLRDLETDHERKMAALSSANTQQKLDAQAKLADADKKLLAANEKAKAKRTVEQLRQEAGSPDEGTAPDPDGFAARIKELLSGAASGLAGAKSSVAGTFSAAQARSLGTGGLEKQQLDTQKRIERYSRRTVDLLRDGLGLQTA